MIHPLPWVIFEIFTFAPFKVSLDWTVYATTANWGASDFAVLI